MNRVVGNQNVTLCADGSLLRKKITIHVVAQIKPPAAWFLNSGKRQDAFDV